MKHRKYQPFPSVALPDRTWPNRKIEKAPIWCSVDLRDGNQALPNPMTLEQKVEMFKLLTGIGFKEIEVGFPSASQVEYDFVRYLIENDLIPDDVAIQVLTPAREPLIEKTCQSLVGAKKTIVHLYYPTSELQRRVVFRKSRDEVKDIAVQGTRWVRKYREQYLAESEVGFEYSPESFMGTEPDYAVEVCEAVAEAWDWNGPLFINLPATVEIETPNLWADRVEWFCRTFKYRDRTIIGAHCHNDRGTGIAAAEFSVLAGVDRLEGTLFGNGERTGNVDLVTLALNLHSQGIDPELDFSRLNDIRAAYERCTGQRVHERYPYSGELVFAAFSGSHQDAISKGMKALDESGMRHEKWEVPYLPIDPADIGREYEPIIRINSQSGKGGAAFVLEQVFGVQIPKDMHPAFGKAVQAAAEMRGAELTAAEIWHVFEREFPEHPSVVTRTDIHISRI